MGHEVEFLTFEGSTPKNRIVSEANEICVKYSDYGGELYNSILFYEIVCKSYEQALDFLTKGANNRDYPELAVRYQVRKPTAKLEKLQEKRNALCRELYDETYFANHTSKRITCGKCGSAINSAFLKRSCHCPVCREDMRPDSVKEKIKLKRRNLEKLDAEILRETGEGKPGQTKWLVRIEYHI